MGKRFQLIIVRIQKYYIFVIYTQQPFQDSSFLTFINNL